MQKNENQNRWAPIVVGITDPYPGLYLLPSGYGEMNPAPSFSQRCHRGRRSRNICSNMFTRHRNLRCEVQVATPLFPARGMNQEAGCFSKLQLLLYSLFFFFQKKNKNTTALLSCCLCCVRNSSQMGPRCRRSCFACCSQSNASHCGGSVLRR